MKYITSLLVILIFIGCNNEPKKQETVLVDTILPARVPPPFQPVPNLEGMPKARALAVEPIPLETVIDYRQRVVDGKIVYDTVVRTKTNKTESVSYTYPVWNEVVKPYVPTTTPVPPLPSTGYLNLKESPPLDLTGKSNMTITGLQFKNAPKNAIYVGNATNITITGCMFNGSVEESIVIEGGNNITIAKNVFARTTTAVYVLSGGANIKIFDNEAVNMRMRSIGGRGQFVQFNGSGGPGCLIENNRIRNYPGESNPEDAISMFKSSGTATSPISIKNNFIWGGGPSTSGGGIMTGDYGGGYQLVDNNVLLDPGQYGIAAAGGNNISLINNKIFARQQPFTNNPLYVWAQQGAACSNINVKGNRVNWTDKNGVKNNGWNAGNCNSTSFEYPTTISLTEIEALMPKPFFKFVTEAELLLIRK